MTRRFQFTIRNLAVLTGWIAVACIIVPAVVRWNRSYWEKRPAMILKPVERIDFA